MSVQNVVTVYEANNEVGLVEPDEHAPAAKIIAYAGVRALYASYLSGIHGVSLGLVQRSIAAYNSAWQLGRSA